MLCTAMALSVSCDVITQIICLRPFQFTKVADNSVRHKCIYQTLWYRNNSNSYVFLVYDPLIFQIDKESKFILKIKN